MSQCVYKIVIAGLLCVVACEYGSDRSQRNGALLSMYQVGWSKTDDAAYELVKQYISVGVGINERERSNPPTTLLVESTKCYKGAPVARLKTIRYLLGQPGIDVNVTDDQNKSALYNTVFHALRCEQEDADENKKRLEIVQLLLDKKADVHLSVKGETVLHRGTVLHMCAAMMWEAPYAQEIAHACLDSTTYEACSVGVQQYERPREFYVGRHRKNAAAIMSVIPTMPYDVAHMIVGYKYGSVPGS